MKELCICYIILATAALVGVYVSAQNPIPIKYDHIIPVATLSTYRIKDGKAELVSSISYRASETPIILRDEQYGESRRRVVLTIGILNE